MTAAGSASATPQRRSSLAPTLFERALAFGAIVILLAVLAALVRGHAHWAEVPTLV